MSYAADLAKDRDKYLTQRNMLALTLRGSVSVSMFPDLVE